MISKDTSTGKHIDDYLIIDTLSSSPTSSVYRAEDIRLKNSTVTLKLLHTMHLSEQRHQQFLKEVHMLKKLKHDHILPILDVGFYESMPYLVTDYAPGGSLRDRLSPQAAHLIPMQEKLSILSQVGQALEYAHQMNIIHGNLKPENILFNAENSVLVTDFSLVTTMDAFSTDHSHHANTFPYMAPEQFQGWMTQESDQYALGCIAYELFTGQVPFLASDFSAIKHKHVTEKPIAPTQRNLLLPIAIEEAILKAMEKKSEDRYPDVKDFVTSLSTSIPGYSHASKLPRAGAILPSSPTSFDQPTRVTDISKDAAPQLAGTGKRTEESVIPQEEVSNLRTIEISSSHTQNANDEQKPLFLGSPLTVTPGAPTQAKLAPQLRPSFDRPIRGAYGRDGNSFYKNPWFILVSLFVVIVFITIGLLHFALPALLSSKSSPAAISQNPLSTPTLTSVPTATPTNTPVLASNPAPTATPSPTPIPTPSPTPSPTPTTLIVTPASFHAESDCQKSGGSYKCTGTLQLPQNHQGNLKWVASGTNLAAFINPSRDALSPGQQQQVTIYVFNSCPHRGTINFSTKEGEVTVPWTC